MAASYKESDLQCSRLAIDVPPVPHFNHSDPKHMLMDLIDHAIVPDPDPPAFTTRQLLATGRTRILGQSLDVTYDAFADTRIDLPQRFDCRARDLDLPSQGASPSSFSASSKAMNS